jgi:mercuric ion transport protein
MSKGNEGSGILGFALVACAACCAGPIIAFLGGIVALGAIGTMLLGAVSLVIAAALTSVVLVSRRRRGLRCNVARGRVAQTTRRESVSNPT